jgi:hypothetical protein
MAPELAAQGNAPRCDARVGQTSGRGGAQIQSLKDLASAATAIVDGQVQSVTPFQLRNNAGEDVFGEDVFIVVRSVLKGAVSTQQVVIRQSLNRAGQAFGGGFKMAPGQRYVLFFRDPGAPEKPGVTRYTLVADPSSKLCVDGNQIRLEPRSTIEARFKDSNVDKTIAEIREITGVVRRETGADAPR